MNPDVSPAGMVALAIFATALLAWMVWAQWHDGGDA